MTMNVYDILAVSETVTDAELKKAWLVARSKHHPDKGGDAELFKKVNKAWDLVDTPIKRQAYDNSRKTNGFHTHSQKQTHTNQSYQAYGRTQEPFNEDLFNEFFSDYIRSKQRQQRERFKDYPNSKQSSKTTKKSSTKKKKTTQNTTSQPNTYMVTLPNVDVTQKILDGAIIKVGNGKKTIFNKLFVKLLPTNDKKIILGKYYLANVLETTKTIPICFQVKWKSPWSWDSQRGLTYKTSRVMKNMLEGGTLEFKDLHGNTIHAIYPPLNWNQVSNGITLKLKGKGWPSVDQNHEDLFVKIKPRKPPKKKV
jgi:DnaJ-class molecular chaperone